jgi:hypothetical protein
LLGHEPRTGESGIVLKRLRDQRIGLMHLFDHIANPGARENLGPASNPLDHCWCFSTPLRCFNLAINIRTGVAAPAFHFEPLVGAKRVYTHRTSH